jgi:hypothetical protein
MKAKTIITVALLLTPVSNGTPAEPLGTAFTYQGKLAEGGQAATGLYEFRFVIYDAAGGGSPLAGPITNSAVAVSNGLFTTTLDFGPGVFTGEARWLEIAVRTNGSPDDFTTLAPRQPLTPAPYALFAAAAGTAGGASNLLGTVGPHQLAGPYTNALALTHPANALAGSFTGDGSGLSNVNAATLGGMPPAGFWQTGGNAGTIPGTHFLGTTDDQPLELRVNNATAFRLLPGNNVVGGAADNAVSPGELFATIAGGTGNRIQSGAAYATVGGGIDNWIGSNAIGATIAGGDGSQIGRGSSKATIAGGDDNDIGADAWRAFIGGGEENTIEDAATHAVLGGGLQNTIQSNANSSVIGGGAQCVIGANSQFAAIAGGLRNRIQAGALASVIGGGQSNTIQSNSSSSVIAGGHLNTIQSSAAWSSIAGGYANTIGSNVSSSTIGGGYANGIDSLVRFSVVGGGWGNTVQSNAQHGVIGGGNQNSIQPDAMFAVVGGGERNTVGPGVIYGVIGGGVGNAILSNAHHAVIGGGSYNRAGGGSAAVPGGWYNAADGAYSFAAGRRAKAGHQGAFVWADATDTDFTSTGSNQFLIRATGGVGINTNQPQSALHVAGTVTADDFRGRGAGLQGVDADRLDGRDSADFAPATHMHNAADITAGTLADARLSANIPRLNAAQTFTAANQFTHAGNVFVGTFQGQGSALTNLDAGNITSGTLADVRLSANIPRLNVPANFTATVSAPVVQASNLIADASSLNNAALTPGLILGGAGSGEGLASKRTTGGNQYGLDLFTAFTSRLAIANNGAIHIGAGNAFATYGDARSSIYVLRGTSSGASYAELFLPGNQRMSVPLNSTWTFRAFVTGRASNGKAAGYCFRGFLENESGTVRVLETVNTEDYAEDDTAWDANLTASDSYDALVITARGNTGDSVRWTAVVYTVEVKW